MPKTLNMDMPIDANLKPIKDSDGTLTSLELSTTLVRVKDIEITGHIYGATQYGWFSLDDDGTQDANENNFGHGSTVTQTSSPFIQWDDTNKVIEVKKAGVYEVVADLQMSINASFSATLKLYLNTAADTLGTALHTVQVLVNTTDDPSPATLRWIGHVDNGQYIALTLDAGSRTPKFETGSTLRIMRIQ